MQQADKTAQDRTIIEKLMTMQDKEGCNCLMVDIMSVNPEPAISIIEELSNEDDLLSVVLAQRNNDSQNCLALALEIEQFAIVEQN